MLTSLIILVIILAVIQAILPMDARLKNLAWVLIVILVCVVLFQVFGGSLRGLNLP